MKEILEDQQTIHRMAIHILEANGIRLNKGNFDFEKNPDFDVVIRCFDKVNTRHLFLCHHYLHKGKKLVYVGHSQDPQPTIMDRLLDKHLPLRIFLLVLAITIALVLISLEGCSTKPPAHDLHPPRYEKPKTL